MKLLLLSMILLTACGGKQPSGPNTCCCPCANSQACESWQGNSSAIACIFKDGNILPADTVWKCSVAGEGNFCGVNNKH